VTASRGETTARAEATQHDAPPSQRDTYRDAYTHRGGGGYVATAREQLTQVSETDTRWERRTMHDAHDDMTHEAWCMMHDALRDCVWTQRAGAGDDSHRDADGDDGAGRDGGGVTGIGAHSPTEGVYIVSQVRMECEPGLLGGLLWYRPGLCQCRKRSYTGPMPQNLLCLVLRRSRLKPAAQLLPVSPGVS
jgi:hypothetical protein